MAKQFHHSTILQVAPRRARRNKTTDTNTMLSIDVEEQIQLGNEVVVSSDSPTAKYGVVFEDDGTVGYLYAIEFNGENYDIVDAMQIYNVSSVIDRDEPSTIQITWSEDGLKALLLINDYPHAVFDFANHKGFCRTNLPSPAPNWKGHEWSEQALEGFCSSNSQS